MQQETAILDRYGLLGYPVGHSKSPIIHRLFAEQTDQPMSYELVEVRPEKLDDMVRSFQRNGGRGLNVTVPHKADVTRLVDELSEAASIAGAVNTLDMRDNHIVGHNTDGVGLIRDLTQNWHCDIAGKRILIFGAGGAAQGIIAPLFELEPDHITIANRTVAKADALANHFGTLGNINATRFADIRDGSEPYDLVINATSAGLSGDEAPFPRAAVSNRQTACYDLSYGLNTTPFIRWAEKVDALRTRSGWGMLIEQAAESFRIWRGVMPDTHDVLKRLPVK